MSTGTLWARHSRRAQWKGEDSAGEDDQVRMFFSLRTNWRPNPIWPPDVSVDRPPRLQAPLPRDASAAGRPPIQNLEKHW